MERSQLFDLMGELQLYGMKAAFDEIMTTAVKRQHEPQRIIGDLLTAEINEKQARSIKYQLTIARRQSMKRWCATSPAVDSSPTSAMPFWSAEPAPAKPTWQSPSPEVAFEPAAAVGSTTWSISSIGSRPKPATRGRDGLPIT